MVRVRVAFLALASAIASTAFAQDTAPPAAPATPPSAAPAPTPAPPPTGDAAQVINLLEHFCVPTIAGDSAEKLARPLGLHRNRDGDFVMSLGGPKRITVTAPNSANPTVCSMTVLYDVGDDTPIYDALNNWALAHANPYVAERKHERSEVGDLTHITSTWSAVEKDGAEGLVFIEDKTADGKPLSSRADQATILFSIRPS